jgi:hypothetical protein
MGAGFLEFLLVAHHPTILLERIYGCRLGLELQFRIERSDTSMQRRPAPEIQIDSVHCRAICEEIGYRLNQFLNMKDSELPPQLNLLLDQLHQRDQEGSPSFAPSLEEMELLENA